MTNRTTLDSLLDASVLYEQPARGYRVALEAPLLARFSVDRRARPFQRVLDLGAGPGAVGLCLAKRGMAELVLAIEVDAEHAELARRNARANGLAARMDVLELDVGRATGPAGDLVIANPPWFEPTAGEVAEHPARAAARAFTRGTLDSFVRAARRLLAPRGRLVMSLPAARFVEALATFATSGLHAKRVRFLHPRECEEADVVFIEAKPGRPGGLTIERPWNVRAGGDGYTLETDDALRGRWPAPSR